MEEEIKKMYGIFDRKTEIITSLINTVLGIRTIDELSSNKQYLLDHAYALEDGLKHEKTVIMALIDEIGKTKESLKNLSDLNKKPEDEKLNTNLTIKATFNNQEDIKKMVEQNNIIENNTKSTSFDVERGQYELTIKNLKLIQYELLKENNTYKQKLRECFEEINLLRQKQDFLLTNDRKLDTGDVITRKDKLVRIFEILLKTRNNETLQKYIEFETNLELSLSSLLYVDDNKLDTILRVLYNIEKKELEKSGSGVKRSTPVPFGVTTNVPKIVLSDNLAKFNLEYKKPKINRNIAFPSSLISLSSNNDSLDGGIFSPIHKREGNFGNKHNINKNKAGLN